MVLPEKARKQALQTLHDVYVGMVRMKAIARSYMWWPRMDADIEQLLRECRTCKLQAQTPARAPLHLWEWPWSLWSRVHIDFAGPYQGHIFFIVVDACSKWLEVKLVRSTSTSEAVRVLRELFATHGLPEVITVRRSRPTISKALSQEMEFAIR